MKCCHYPVTGILRTTQDENLMMIGDTVRHLKQKGLEVVFDGEIFFDGYKANPNCVLKALAAAADADCLCLCDINGGSFPEGIFGIFGITGIVGRRLGTSIRIRSGTAGPP